MALVKAHWRFALFNFLILAAVSAGLVRLWIAGTVQARFVTIPEPPVPVDDVTLDRVATLRNRLCVSNEDLAAFGCGRQNGKVAILAVLQWYRNSAAQLREFETAEGVAQKQIEELDRRIRVGPRSDSVVQQRVAAAHTLATLNQQHHALLGSADAVIQAALPQSQAQVWQIAKANRGLPVRFRYVPTFRGPGANHLLMLAAKLGESSPEVRQAEMTDLSPSSRAARDTALNNAETNLPEVLLGEQDVLRPPANGG